MKIKIKKITLENFQSHKNTEIPISDGMTVILGPTDQGKSSIIRALKWVLYNEPRGSDFVTVGCNTCRVSLEMSDGTIITREREGNKNRYILLQEGNEQVFEGFGAKVPLEIVQSHGIPKIQIDTDRSTIVNISDQLEPPFLLSDSGGNRAKALGRLVGIHIIDAAQRTTLRDLVETQQHNKALSKAVEELKEELAKYDDIPSMEKRICQMEEVLKKLKERERRYLRLCATKNGLTPTEKEIAENRRLISKLGFLDLLSWNTTRVKGLHIKLIKIKEIRYSLLENKVAADTEEAILTRTSHVHTAELRQTEAENKTIRLSKFLKLKQDIHRTIDGISTTEIVVGRTAQVSGAENMLVMLLEKLLKHSNLQTTKEKVKNIETQIGFERARLQKSSNINTVDKDIIKATIAMEKHSKLTDIERTLKDVLTSLETGLRFLADLDHKIGKMTREYGAKLTKLSKCPTCLSPLDDNTATKIVSEILDNCNVRSEGFGFRKTD